MTCKGQCAATLRTCKVDKLLSELRNAIDEGQCHQYLMGLVIAIEILREE